MKKHALTDLNGRFAGEAGHEYERLLAAVPHVPIIEREIGECTRRAVPRKFNGIRFILDLGCGSGLTTLAVAARVNRVCIIAVDNEPEMLKQFKRNVLTQQKLANHNGVIVKMVQDDALRFLRESKPSTFEVVVSGFMLHNLPAITRLAILRQVARVLKPGGRFVNGDKIARDNEKKHRRDLMSQLAKLAQCYDNPKDSEYGLSWIEHYLRDNQLDLKCTEAEVRQHLKSVGLKNVRIIERHGLDALVVADKPK